MLICAMSMCVAADDKQIQLEDIERDMLVDEKERTGDEDQQQLNKELSPQPTQHIQLSYSNDPQDVFVTPQPQGRYKSVGERVECRLRRRACR